MNESRNQTATKSQPRDVQESLKILQFRYGQRVGFRPAVVRCGETFYPVEGKLCSESEIVGWFRTA